MGVLQVAFGALLRTASFALATLIAHAFLAPANAEPFIGQFELKTLESARGSFEFQSQNAWSWGEPSRRIAGSAPDDFEVDENAAVRQRHALELEMGFTRFVKMRVGIEFEKERLDDPATLGQANDFGGLELAEVGAEVIAIFRPRHSDGVGWGVVAELEGPVDQEAPNHFIVGPIVELQSGRWFAAAVPMVVRAFGGDAEEGKPIDDKWDFAYATQLVHTFSPNWSLALEGYGTVERLGNTGHPSDAARRFGDFDQHRAGFVLYYTYDFGGSRAHGGTRLQPGSPSDPSGEDDERSLSIGLGLLEGLNGNTPNHTLKLSIEVQF